MMLSEWHTPESPNDGIMTCPLHPIKASVSHFVERWRISAHAKQVQFGIFTIPVRIESEIKDGDRAIIESSNYYFAAIFIGMTRSLNRSWYQADFCTIRIFTVDPDLSIAWICKLYFIHTQKFVELCIIKLIFLILYIIIYLILFSF